MKILNDCLYEFRTCFSRTTTFSWFVIIIVSMMIRHDHLGITSVIRDLCLNENHYPSLLHFFHSNAWRLEKLNDKWIQIVLKIAPLDSVDDTIILVGDGVKQAKEARCMPGVKKHHQESENQSKATYIFGHLFGGVGILIGNTKKLFCLPLSLRIHDGIKPIAQWTKDEVKSQSHVVQMIHQAHHVVRLTGKKAVLLLDRYFLSVPALVSLNQLTEANQTDLHLVTKAKRSCVAYTEAPAKAGRRGRPRKKGYRVKLLELFETHASEFLTAKLELYGKIQEVSYQQVDLLWGKGLYQKLRFVLVNYNGTKSILVSTDLNLTPEKIIELYAKRFKIECTFREMKQSMGGFDYHFWSKSMPRLNYYQKKDAPHPLDEIKSEKERLAIIKKIKAIEGYVLCSAIALGLLQIISLKLGTGINLKKIRFLRTYSNDYASETTIREYMRNQIFMMFSKSELFPIMQIIKSKQKCDFFSEETTSLDKVS
jgi:hypothetical protein